MLLTYKIRHTYNFSDELSKAKQVAQFAIDNRVLSTKYVKHIGLKSVIANQILRKYSRNKKAKRANKVKLTIPQQGIKQDGTQIKIPSLNVSFDMWSHFGAVRQIEVDNNFFYVTCQRDEQDTMTSSEYIGIDRNTTKHVVVAALPNGKVLKLGKQAPHIHQKYKNIRKKLQSNGKFKALKKIKNRESRIIRDINHKISKKIVDIAFDFKYGIRLEELKGIRNNKSKKYSKAFNYNLHSWSYYQLQQFIGYKAKLRGVIVGYINPHYTSQLCSRCGSLGERVLKSFKCLNPKCKHIDHADVNASFNISKGQFGIERDMSKGTTGSPKVAIVVASNGNS